MNFLVNCMSDHIDTLEDSIIKNTVICEMNIFHKALYDKNSDYTFWTPEDPEPEPEPEPEPTTPEPEPPVDPEPTDPEPTDPNPTNPPTNSNTTIPKDPNDPEPPTPPSN